MIKAKKLIERDSFHQQASSVLITIDANELVKALVSAMTTVQSKKVRRASRTRKPRRKRGGKFTWTEEERDFLRKNIDRPIRWLATSFLGDSHTKEAIAVQRWRINNNK